MNRPRIIIADEDIDYIATIQLKFVQEYFDAVDMEIITDRNYFLELFSAPQSADILMVSDKLFDQSLQRHNISSLFVMTEYEEEPEQLTDWLNVNFIYKYTSINSIFNKVVGQSDITVVPATKKAPQIVLVMSSSGGTGKTTISLGIAKCLKKNYKKSLYINAARLQCFQSRLQNKSAITSNQLYASLNTMEKDIYPVIKTYIRNEGFDYIPPFKASLMSLGVDYSIYECIATEARDSGDYDFVIVDCDTVLDEYKADLINVADIVVIVLNQDKDSVLSANTLVNNININGNDKFIFICNKYDEKKRNSILFSSNIKFSVNEYVEDFGDMEDMTLDELSMRRGMQKAAYLII